MTIPESIRQQTCRDCLAGKDLGFAIEMALMIMAPVTRVTNGWSSCDRTS